MKVCSSGDGFVVLFLDSGKLQYSWVSIVRLIAEAVVGNTAVPGS